MEQVALDENGKPKASVYGADFAQYLTVQQIAWLLNSPFGEHKENYASLVKQIKQIKKGKKKGL